MNNRHIAFVAEVLAAGGSTAPAHSQHTWKPMIAGGRGGVHAMENSEVLSYFQVIEFRRYIIGEGALEHFAQHFESCSPEAFQPLGAVAAGVS